MQLYHNENKFNYPICLSSFNLHNHVIKIKFSSSNINTSDRTQTVVKHIREDNEPQRGEQSSQILHTTVTSIY